MPVAKPPLLDSATPSLLIVDRRQRALSVEKVALGKLMHWLFDPSSHLARPIRSWSSKALWLSRFVGWFSRLSLSKKMISSFVRDHQLSLDDFEEPVGGWKSFDDFFSRSLRPGARPCSRKKTIAYIPADGRYRRLEKARTSLFSVKGEEWNLEKLLGPLLYAEEGQKDSQKNISGALLARLCPTDYHRFHSPVAGKIGRILPMGERLHSVHAWSLLLYPQLLSENKRVGIELLTDQGRWILVAVGACFVGSITLSVKKGDRVEAMDELGAFHFGGSSLVIVHESELWQEAEDLTDLWKEHPDKEILTHVGEPMKVISSHRSAEEA